MVQLAASKVMLPKKNFWNSAIANNQLMIWNLKSQGMYTLHGVTD